MDFTSYTPLLWLLMIIPIGIAFIYSLINRRPWMKRLAFLLRVVAVTALVLALCQPFISLVTDKKHLVFMLDCSESVSMDAIAEQHRQIKKLTAEMDLGDSMSLLCFADSASRITPEQLEEQIKAWRAGTGDSRFRQATKLTDALQAAKLLYPANRAKQLIIMSDGMATDGNPAPVLNDLMYDGMNIQFLRMAQLDKPEAAIVEFSGDRTAAYLGEKVRLTAKITANRDMKVILKFINRNVVVKAVPVMLNKEQPQLISDEFIIDDESSGVWRAELSAENDYFPFNNRAAVTIEVKGKMKVLALHVRPVEMRPFVRAMRKQGITVEVRGRMGCPTEIKEMLDFDAIIIADFPATAMSVRQMEMLRQYVRDYGRGLIMTGSENSFGLGGYYKTPVEDVLPVISRYEKEQELPSLAMVLVIDKSGSMGGMKISLARQAGKAAVELLGLRDYIGVIAFDGQPVVIAEMTSAVSAGQVVSAIDSIAAGGGTNLYPAMVKGKEMLDQTSAKIKHMIVLSDGQSMPGDFDGITSGMAGGGITVSTVALGGGAHRALMSRIAELGRGRYYETLDADNVPRIFARETIKASRSAIKEEPFGVIKIGDADFLNGIDFSDAPYLLGYVMTRTKPMAEVQLLCEKGDPLLASGQFGLGRGISFTSDLTAKWSSEWLEWKSFGKLWAQIIRAAAPNRDADGINLTTTVKRNKVTVTIRCRDINGIPLTGIKWHAALASNNSSQLLPVTEYGYGLYKTEFERSATDNYSLALNDLTRRKTKTLYWNAEYPREYLLDNRVSPVLSSLESFSADKITARVGSVTAGFPAANIFAIIALFALMGSVLCRRL
ncbi:MAG: VWA domain-containing protein [Victivallaceae bacterium]|nr:VWA domain-containing protein [Victivallaceae bacterium]